MARTTFTIDESRSRIAFWLRYLTFKKIEGTFARLTGRIELDDADAAKSSVELDVDVNGVRTGNDERDKTIAESFFGAPEFPRVTFKSKVVERTGESYRVTGDLTMRGATHPLTVDVRRSSANDDARISFVTKVELPRKRWGVVAPSQGDHTVLLIGAIVTLDITIDAKRVD